MTARKAFTPAELRELAKEPYDFHHPHLLDALRSALLFCADVIDAANEALRQPGAAASPAPGRAPLTDEQIDAVADAMPDGLTGFLKTWGYRQFARAILELRAMPAWEPNFDAIAHKQEELALQFCLEIAGKRGQKGSPPDPVRLLEMAEALYKAERSDAQGIAPAGGIGGA